MTRNLLTDRALRNAKPRERDYRLRDGDGLFVLVARTGGKSFQYRYKLRGKPDTITLKDAMSLADAREKVEPLRKLVAAGDDPKGPPPQPLQPWPAAPPIRLMDTAATATTGLTTMATIPVRTHTVRTTTAIRPTPRTTTAHPPSA